MANVVLGQSCELPPKKKSTKDVLQRKREDCSKCQDVSLNFGNDSMLWGFLMLSSSAQENARRQLSLKSTEASYIQLQGGTAGIVGIKNNLFE